MTVLLPKLNWVVGAFAKTRHYIPIFLLKTVYYSLFNSHLIYACQIWGQTKNDLFRKIEKLQDKILRIINFLPKGTPINDTYENSKILKLQDYISLQNALLVKDCLVEQLPKPLINHFKKTNTQHEHSTQKTAYSFPTFVLIDMLKTQSNTNLNKYGMNYNVILISTY